MPGVAAPAPASPPGSELTVSLMTMGPGAEVWERFGHNAIWIEDHGRGSSIAYNYGLFSFRQENFIWRFIQGRMLYWMAGFDALPYAEFYRRDHRSVWVQELNLPPAARLELRDFLEWNAREENKFYHYDYYRDNCSTRVRDALDRVLQGEIRRQTDSLPTGVTYRSETRRLSLTDFPIYTGLMLLLGPRADRPLSAWEQMFLPVKLQEHARTITVPDGAGGRVPLVKSERTLYLSDIYPEPGPVAPPVLRMGLLGIGLGLVALLLGRWGRRVPVGRSLFLAWSALMTLVLGLAGAILVGLWGLTDHRISYGNQNVLQTDVLSLPLAALLAVALVRPQLGRPWALRLGWAVVALSALGFLVTLVQASQQNLEIAALALPLNLGVAVGVTWCPAGGRGAPSA